MRILLINNYDSYADLLAYTLWSVSGVKPTVIHNDAWTADAVLGRGFDRIVLSPGPGHPGQEGDFGVCGEVIARCDVPLLGVCLGHQGLALAAGAQLVLAPQVRHGKQSRIRHTGHGLFAGVPRVFSAMRYHSWVVDAQGLPGNVQVVARALDDDTVMALALRDRPAVGVQFHPESVGTVWGRRILGNFVQGQVVADAAASRVSKRRRPTRVQAHAPVAIANADAKPADTAQGPAAHARDTVAPSERCATAALPRRRVHFESIAWRDPERVFERCFAHLPDAFWLDSAAAGADQRWSFMGAPQAVLQARAGGMVQTTGDDTLVLSGDPVAAWRRVLADKPLGMEALPCPFAGGLVGWLGYDLRDAGADSAALPAGPDKRTDSVMHVCRRFVAFDHVRRRVLVVTVQRDAGAAKLWLAGMRAVVERIDATPTPADFAATPPGADAWPAELKPCIDRRGYLHRIAQAQAQIKRGEIYEVCLSNRFEMAGSIDPWRLYRTLRRTNPAPFAAFIKSMHVSVLSASPERFLTLDADGVVTTEPIKGTRAHVGTPGAVHFQRRALRASPKDRAELLMIVDLLRNDLARVAERGSVRVAELFKLTKHPTVVQMSATLKARLQAGCDALDLLHACFPGGSITGAPKRRAMGIIHGLEGRPRGVYTGAIGYMSYNGAMDLNVAIRTLTHQPHGISFGAGGAVVADSEPEAECDEVDAKAFALARAVMLTQNESWIDRQRSPKRRLMPCGQLQ